MYKLIVIAALIGVAISSRGKIDNTLVQSLKTKNVANIMISFVGGNTHVINSIESRSFESLTQKRTSLKAALESQASKSQQSVIAVLKSKNVEHKSFWISNQIFIRGAQEQLVNELAAFPEVELIAEEGVIVLDTPVETSSSRRADPAPLAEWGIEKIQAPEAWKISTGTGVVVATIDSGVRYTHEALRSNYRGGDNSWLDPEFRTQEPTDTDRHGTHTMGTIVGTENGIGVAPGAKWIACRACVNSFCYDNALVGCAQWMICPTKFDGTDADCAAAPSLVSNSWGGGRGNLWFDSFSDAWIAAGIIPIFSIGNGGPNCGTAGSPGEGRRIIGVGSTNVRDEISEFSAVGPAADGRIKPDITAPGEDIFSSVSTGDAAYGSSSGTSMACPHVAGVTALLLSVNPNMTFADVRDTLLAGVETNLTLTDRVCGGIADTTFPNHHFGFGRINALKVVEAAKAALKH